MDAFHALHDDDECVSRKQAPLGLVTLKRDIFDAWVENLDEDCMRLFNSRADVLV
jgi:hypothetical protein